MTSRVLSISSIERVVRVRSRVVSVLGFLAAAASLGFCLWGLIAAPGGIFTLTALWLILLQMALCLAGGLLAWFVHREWGTRLLGLALIVIPSLLILQAGFPHEVALASFLGVIFIMTIGGRPVDTAAATLLVGVLSIIMTGRHSSTAESVAAALATTAALLVTGAVLTGMSAILHRTVYGLDASKAYFQHLSHIDPLTGLGNRRMFDLGLAEALAHAGPETPLALVLLDLDNLKHINDAYSHVVGDEALRLVANVIRDSTRGSDIAARIGGDEFCIVLTSGGLQGAEHIAERIERKLDQIRFGPQRQVRLSASIGLAETADASTTPIELLAAADAGLYRSRRNNRRTLETEAH
jgi:diguanylate cyclase (GGDEF)-like protein